MNENKTVKSRLYLNISENISRVAGCAAIKSSVSKLNNYFINIYCYFYLYLKLAVRFEVETFTTLGILRHSKYSVILNSMTKTKKHSFNLMVLDFSYSHNRRNTH